MSNLLNCVHCGHLVSPSATSCPACRATDPNGVPCFVCRKPMKIRDAFRYNEFGNIGKFAIHRSCFDQLYVPPQNLHIQCPDCGNAPKTAQDILDHSESCQRCGRSSPFGASKRCDHCTLPVLPLHQYGQVDYGHESYSHHDRCHAPWRTVSLGSRTLVRWLIVVGVGLVCPFILGASGQVVLAFALFIATFVGLLATAES